ncbi:ATP-binding protein [Methylicorpusculum oleiharenae]|uniref:AlbA family DNA-binding domain-containing protein n=1 Tax=Methylicorpusculum oleiharenae TaxID=1338687 RepID=UPI001358222D|nr:ATP-binding protein [Methylicorpusculum oleiharenae]MCD2449822.1 ATP-binding protein [Methylicorpusculum oleiharenae]
MKPIFSLSISTKHYRTGLFYLFAALIGSAAGFFILFPINEFVYYHEHEKFDENAVNVTRFVLGQMIDALAGHSPQKTAFYAVVGMVFGLSTAKTYAVMHKRWIQIQQLSEELGKDLLALISQGEGPLLEFKSSFRWDMEQERVNRALEGVVLKTLAGFMNANGGTLLIGVADDGSLLNLNKDYQTLKKPGRDAYEQLIMSAIASQMGADTCQFIRIVFHTLDFKDICRVIVLPASRPVFIKQGNDPKLYLRTGGGTRELNVQEAMEYMKQRWHK